MKKKKHCCLFFFLLKIFNNKKIKSKDLKLKQQNAVKKLIKNNMRKCK